MNDKKVWPANMYVVDMVYGFRKMKELKTAHAGDYAQRFKSAGRTSAGNWAAFASSVPLRGEKLLKQPKHHASQ